MGGPHKQPETTVMIPDMTYTHLVRGGVVPAPLGVDVKPPNSDNEVIIPLKYKTYKNTRSAVRGGVNSEVNPDPLA